MVNKELPDFLKQYYPDILEVYKRFITPNYYECGVEYYPQVSGFGGTGKDYKKLVFVNVTIYKERKDFHLAEVGNPKEKYIVTESEAPFRLKRVNEHVEYKDNIIDSKKKIYITVYGIEYSIHQIFFRAYKTNKLAFRVLIEPVEDTGKRWEYYNYALEHGSKGNILKYYPDGNINSQYYTIQYNVPVRKMKELIFGNPNVKIK